MTTIKTEGDTLLLFFRGTEIWRVVWIIWKQALLVQQERVFIQTTGFIQGKVVLIKNRIVSRCMNPAIFIIDFPLICDFKSFVRKRALNIPYGRRRRGLSTAAKPRSDGNRSLIFNGFSEIGTYISSILKADVKRWKRGILSGIFKE